MPKRRKDNLPRIPKLCHREDGRHFVTDPGSGKQIYFNSSDPLGEYEDWRRQFLERIKEIMEDKPAEPVKAIAGQRLTVARLCELYLDHARQWYQKDGEETSQVAVVRMVTRRLNSLAGEKQVNRLRVADVEAFQQRMIDDGLARRTCNQLLHVLRAMARWAVRKEVMDGETLSRILSVPTLRKGRTQAKETRPVRVVDSQRVEATLPHLPPVYRAMVELQLYSAMRPGEVCGLSAIQLNRAVEPWEYIPSRYKTQHHHDEDDPRRRRIFLGPQARAVLLPFLTRNTDPKEPLFRRPNGKRMSIDAYYYAIRAACEKHGIPRWAPNRLRHTMATQVREQHGLEAAQDYLGHDTPQTTLIYAERSHERARKIAEEMG